VNAQQTVKKRLLIAFGIIAGITLAVIIIPTLPRPSFLSFRQSPPDLRFAVVGDTHGHFDILQNVAARAENRQAAFLLHTGDITENATAEEFARLGEIRATASIPWYVAPGNHDRFDGAVNRFAVQFGRLPRAESFGRYRLVVLDNSDRQAGFSADTLRWLRSDLADHPEQIYVIAYHRPFGLPLSTIFGDDETPASSAANQEFLKTLVGQRIAAIFSGHLHIYLPYTLSGLPAYVTGGGGGEPQSALGTFGQQKPHFLLIELRGQSVRVEVVPLR